MLRAFVQTMGYTMFATTVSITGISAMYFSYYHKYLQEIKLKDKGI